METRLFLKKIFLILTAAAIAVPSYSETYDDRIPEEYTRDEFPAPLRRLRRAEVIFVGSYPFSLLFTKLGMDMADYAMSGFDRSHAPALLGGSRTQPPDSGETRQILINALYVSAAVAFADLIISIVSDSRKTDAD